MGEVVKMEPVGGNAANLLLDLCIEIEDLERQIARLSADEKEFWKTLRKAQMPVKGFRKALAWENKDEDKVDDERREMSLANTILGLTMPTRHDKAVSLKQYDPELIERAQNTYRQVQSIRTEIADIKESIKDVKKRAKDEGFIPKVFLATLAFRKDPDNFANHSALVDTHITALVKAQEARERAA